MPTAKITLNVSTFNANGCSVIDRPSIDQSAGNRVYMKSNVPTSPDFNTIAVKSKGKSELDIEFTITPSTLFPTAMTFSQTNGNGDANGSANFGTPSIAGNKVTIKDVFALDGPTTNAPQWNYTIAIKNSDTPAKTSAIDPGIENTNEV